MTHKHRISQDFISTFKLGNKIIWLIMVLSRGACQVFPPSLGSSVYQSMLGSSFENGQDYYSRYYQDNRIHESNKTNKRDSLGEILENCEYKEKCLIRALLNNYDKRVRPVVDGETPLIQDKIYQISVEFGLSLIQILQLNEMDQVLSSSFRVLFRWRDYHLQWRPEEFDNLTEIYIPPHKVWIPDIHLYNYADERLEETRISDVRVHYNGTMEWFPTAIFKSTCSVRIKHFPFDTQLCRWKFGPWTHDGFQVNISYFDKKPNLTMSSYIKSTEWDIVNHMGNYTVTYYPCCPEPYPDITYIIVLKRKATTYVIYLIVPCFLLSMITLLLFWLPPDNPAKMVLGVNIFTAFFYLLLVLEEYIPSAATEFPLIGKYYCVSMTLITVSMFLCLFVVNFHYRGDNRKPVPNWLIKALDNRFVRLLCYDMSEIISRRIMQENDESPNNGKVSQERYQTLDQNNQFFSSILDEDEFKQMSLANFYTKTLNSKFNNNLSYELRVEMLSRDVCLINKTIGLLEMIASREQDTQLINEEWRTVGLILDRLFFFAYYIMTLFSMALCFPRPDQDETMLIDKE